MIEAGGKILFTCSLAFLLTAASGAHAESTEPAPQPAEATPASSSAQASHELADSWLVPSLHAAGLMTVMRLGEAVIWPDPFADTDLHRIGQSYERAYTKPPLWDSDRPAFEWDGDPWYVNTIGHGLFGSELFLRARTCQKTVVEALVFTAIGSTLWEYGFEANAVRPSALDLVYTPVAGLVFGEARYIGWRAAAQIENRGWRRVLMVLVDPFGELERAAGTPC